MLPKEKLEAYYDIMKIQRSLRIIEEVGDMH